MKTWYCRRHLIVILVFKRGWNSFCLWLDYCPSVRLQIKSTCKVCAEVTRASHEPRTLYSMPKCAFVAPAQKNSRTACFAVQYLLTVTFSKCMQLVLLIELRHELYILKNLLTVVFIKALLPCGVFSRVSLLS